MYPGGRDLGLAAVGGGAQGGIHLEAPVLFQVVLAEQQIVRRRLAGHVHSPCLCPADKLHAFFGGDVADVIGASARFRKRQIPLHLPVFACRGNAPVPVPCGVVAVVDVATVQQAVVLAVRRHRLSELSGKRHCLPHPLLRLHPSPVVRKGADVRCHFLQRRQLLSLLPDGQRTVRIHRDHRIPPDGVHLLPQVGKAVRHRIQIRHGAYRRVAAPCRRHCPAPDSLLIKITRLP